MCGICGIKLPASGPIGRYLVDMCQAMRHRGYDSTGFALYGEPVDGRLVLRLRIVEAAHTHAALDALEGALRERGVTLADEHEADEAVDAPDRFVRALVKAGTDQVRDIVRAVDDAGHGIEVQSIGRSLEIIKDLGDAETVNARHGVDRFTGSHGLGHVRLTTESIVDVAYGHPFWAEPFPDISIVHNGQITNYFRFRRLLTQEGYRFHTSNDSELIAVYLADRMLHGETLWDALKTSVDELDGCFAYLFATEDEMGSAKDPLAIKSLVAANVDGVMAIATEEQALRQVNESELDVDLPEPRSIYVWDRDGHVTTEIV
jgi:glutamine phosphoribosylpyrophosphate amidotransferase